MNAGNKNTPSTHHPRRRNVATLMVGLKNGHIRKTSHPKVVNPRDIAAPLLCPISLSWGPTGLTSVPVCLLFSQSSVLLFPLLSLITCPAIPPVIPIIRAVVPATLSYHLPRYPFCSLCPFVLALRYSVCCLPDHPAVFCFIRYLRSVCSTCRMFVSPVFFLYLSIGLCCT